MSKICRCFDTYYDLWNTQIGALCFLLCRSRRGSRDVAFQTFLRLGGAKNGEIGQEEARMLLFGSAVRLCDDYYLKKMHKMPSRKRLEEENLPFEMTDGMYAFLRLPFRRRAALTLAHFGFTVDEIAQLLRIRAASAQKLIADPGIPGWQAAIDAAALTEDESLIMNDRIYTRFAERSVGVENAIHDARNTFDRLAPYLALAVIALFAFSVWYVS